MSNLGFAERPRIEMRAGLLLLFLCSFALALPSAGAQEAPEPAVKEPAPAASSTLRADEETAALEAFVRGTSAFDEAQYEEALRAFEESFRLGGQGETQYNIGLAAQRLGQDEKALAAFRAYLELVEEPPLELEAQAHIRGLYFSGVESDPSVSVTYQATEPFEPDALPKRKRAVVGPVIFMALGLAGLGAMTAGFMKDGKCVDRDETGTCTEEATLNKTPVIVYGSLGGAFLFSGAIWIGLSGRTRTVFGLGPGTIQVKGRF